MTSLYLIRVQRDGEVWKKMPAFTILSCILFVLLSRWYSIFTILFCCQIIIVIISLCNCFTSWHLSLCVFTRENLSGLWHVFSSDCFRIFAFSRTCRMYFKFCLCLQHFYVFVMYNDVSYQIQNIFVVSFQFTG